MDRNIYVGATLSVDPVPIQFDIFYNDDLRTTYKKMSMDRPVEHGTARGDRTMGNKRDYSN